MKRYSEPAILLLLLLLQVIPWSLIGWKALGYEGQDPLILANTVGPWIGAWWFPCAILLSLIGTCLAIIHVAFQRSIALVLRIALAISFALLAPISIPIYSVAMLFSNPGK